MSIRLFYNNNGYRIRDRKKVVDLIGKVIRREGKAVGDLSYIITNDNHLLDINKEFLKRNTLTDVIAFDYGTGIEAEGEIYISINSVRRNANNYKVSLRKELLRVIIHGTLHLCGYSDKTKAGKKSMTDLEDMWLKEIYKK